MKIFRSPWFYTGIMLFLSFFTSLLDPFYKKLNYLLLQPVPDSQIDDTNYTWVNFYTFVFGLLLPIFLVFFASKYLIKKYR